MLCLALPPWSGSDLACKQKLEMTQGISSGSVNNKPLSLFSPWLMVETVQLLDKLPFSIFPEKSGLECPS